MLGLCLISFVHAWNLQCGESGVKLTIPAADLLNLTGVADHRLLHMGARHYDRRECRAYMDPEEGTVGFTYELDHRCGTSALVKCGNGAPSHSGCTSAERKIHYTNEIYANPMLMYSLIGFGPRFAGTAASRRVFNWECVYDTHYAVDLEMPRQNVVGNENVPDELVYSDDGLPTDFMKLSLNAAAFSQPDFGVKDLLPKYEMSASYGHQFYVIDGDWVSTQIVMSHEDKSHAQMEYHAPISHCWLSDKISPIYDKDGDVDVVKHGCAVDTKRTIVYESPLPHVTRFAWRTDLKPNFEIPIYLHCEIRVCFANEQCPTMCTFGNSPDAYWTSSDRYYTPLQLHTTLGPFLRADSSLIDASIMREVEPSSESSSLVEEISDSVGAKADIEDSSSPPELDELKFDRELPVWGKALVGTCTIAVVSVTIVTAVKVLTGQPLWRQTGLYRVSCP